MFFFNKFTFENSVNSFKATPPNIEHLWEGAGKKILNLKVVNIDGGKPDLKGIMISSFGKSFLLPIDLILGWFLTNAKRQRVFNKLGDTLIVKIKELDDIADIRYTKD